MTEQQIGVVQIIPTDEEFQLCYSDLIGVHNNHLLLPKTEPVDNPVFHNVSSVPVQLPVTCPSTNKQWLDDSFLFLH